MKKLKFITLLSYLLLFANLGYALEGGVEYDGVYIDYKSMDYNEWQTKAEKYLDLAKKNKEKNEQKKYYALAAGAYQTLIEINSSNAVIMATLGHIYGKLNRPEHAKAFLDRGLNLAITNPIVNYYYGIFYQDERDFRNALKFYNYAYRYGMDNDIDLNLRLSTVNSKLGELNDAKKYKLKAFELKKNSNKK